jgi:hypothetical protein
MHDVVPPDRYPPVGPLLDLIRPSFFPGQSLTDSDLTALVKWVEGRLRLGAACDDWGIVCGLQVTIDPDDPGAIRVTRGYGFNAARQLCVLTGDCCCEKNGSQRAPDSAAGVKKKLDECRGACDSNSETVLVGPFEAKLKKGEEMKVDLVLYPHECGRDKSLALLPDGGRRCRPGRMKASGTLKLVEAFEPTISAVPPAPAYVAELPDLGGAPDDSLSDENAKKVKDWLKKYSKELPGLTTLQAAWAAMAVEPEMKQSALVDHLKWILFGFAPAGDCPPCATDDPAIRVARITARCNGTKPEIVWIDMRPPYRNTYDCGPKFRPADWIGAWFERADAVAKLCGIEIRESEVQTVSQLKEWCTSVGGRAWSCGLGEELEVLLAPWTGERRIVAFRSKDRKPLRDLAAEAKAAAKKAAEVKETAEKAKQKAAEAKDTATKAAAVKDAAEKIAKDKADEAKAAKEKAAAESTPEAKTAAEKVADEKAGESQAAEAKAAKARETANEAAQVSAAAQQDADKKAVGATNAEAKAAAAKVAEAKAAAEKIAAEKDAAAKAAAKRVAEAKIAAKKAEDARVAAEKDAKEKADAANDAAAKVAAFPQAE